jgi:hypothetical protein
VTSKVPFSDRLVGLGLDATLCCAHLAYGVTERMGIMTSGPDYDEVRARIMTQLLSLADLSTAVKDKFLQALYAEAGKQQFLMGMDKDLFFSLTLQQDAYIETWTKGFGGLYDVSDSTIGYVFCVLFPFFALITIVHLFSSI